MTNEEIVHSVKNKLSPFLTLAQLAKMDVPEHMRLKAAERCEKLMPEIVKLLEEIE